MKNNNISLKKTKKYFFIQYRQKNFTKNIFINIINIKYIKLQKGCDLK